MRPFTLRPFGATTISSSDGTLLRFESRDELAAYEAGIAEVEMRHYHQARARYGVWASNQGKYVASPELFNQWDDREMERRYASWLAKQPKDLP